MYSRQEAVKPRASVVWSREGRAPRGSVAVAVDVLRASTTLVTALAGGAREVRVVKTVPEARRLARARKALLVGERASVRIPGFDHGNSPAELAKASLRGVPVVLTSTNFPRAVAAAAPAAVVLAGCVANITSASRAALRLARARGLGICFVLAGETLEARAAEDLCAAALGLKALAGACLLEGSAREALGATLAAARRGPHARELRAKGFSRDVAFALRPDRFCVVPVLSRGAFRPLQ